MTDYLKTGHLDEAAMNPEYREAEERFRSEAKRLWDQNRKIQADTRRRVLEGKLASPEEAESEYMQRYCDEVQPKYQKLASEHVTRTAGRMAEDRAKLTQGVGQRFSDHLVNLADKSDEQLESIHHTAKRTGQDELVAATAQVALDRNQFELYRQWSQDDPGRARALERLRSTPDVEQLAARTQAMKPPIAARESLMPSQAETQEFEKKRAAAEATAEYAKREFYGGPRVRHFVGRHSS
jgi:hypothetical protein